MSDAYVPDAPWAAPFVLALIGAAGLAYLVAAKPHRRLAEVVER